MKKPAGYIVAVAQCEEGENIDITNAKAFADVKSAAEYIAGDYNDSFYDFVDDSELLLVKDIVKVVKRLRLGQTCEWLSPECSPCQIMWKVFAE